jgi:hypothetical protein
MRLTEDNEGLQFLSSTFGVGRLLYFALRPYPFPNLVLFVSF